MHEWKERGEDASNSGDFPSGKSCNWWLVINGGRGREKRELAIKVSSLGNRCGNMKPYRRPVVIEGISVNVFVKNNFKKTLLHPVSVRMCRPGT